MRFPVLFVLAGGLLAGCAPHGPVSYQGYFEGEFVYVASPLASRLEHLAVAKGARVEAGASLFTLERTADLAGQREAADQLRSAQARLEDLKKGSRPSELASYCRAGALDLQRTSGMAYNPITQRYWLNSDTSVNYMFATRKAG